MNKKLIIYSVLGIFGLSGAGVYLFKKPKLVIGKVDAAKQMIEFTFDGQSYVFPSGTQQSLKVSSRNFTLEVRDVVSKTFGIKTGFIKFTVVHFSEEIVIEDNYNPLAHGYITWKWDNANPLIIGQ